MTSDQNNKKILLVDDDKFLLEMYARKFSNSGFEVLSAITASDALDKILNNKDINTLLLDIIMPEMDGLELLKKIKTQNLIPESKNIVLSNQGQKVEIEKAEKIGIDGYIIKALHTPSEVVSKVNQIINN